VSRGLLMVSFALDDAVFLELARTGEPPQSTSVYSSM
jgi:hypothetical protein